MHTVLLLLLVIFLLATEHWYPHWRTLLGKEITHPRRLQNNYVAGILAIFIPFSIWLLLEGYVRVGIVMWIFIAIGGLAVFLMYQHDANVSNRNALLNEKTINELLKKMRKDAPDKRP